MDKQLLNDAKKLINDLWSRQSIPDEVAQRELLDRVVLVTKELEQAQARESPTDAVALFRQAIKHLLPLIYYSHIHTVKGVRPAEFNNHETELKEAQKFVWDNCDIVNGKYIPKLFNPSGAAPQAGNKTKEAIIAELEFALENPLNEEEKKQIIYPAMELYAERFAVPAPPAGPVDYKDDLRQMMKETNSDLLIHIPEVSATGRVKAQIIMMDEFFKAFPPGTDLEQLRKQYNEIKPIV